MSIVFLSVGALAPIIAPYDPNDIHMPDRLEGPSRDYWLGTDEFGRDLLGRIIYGARIAFQAGVIAVTIAITAIWGPSTRHAMVSIGIATIPDFARVTRGVVLPTKELPFVEAARVSGYHGSRILRTAILPNCLPSITVLLSFSVANSILYESALSFLGLGAQPPEPSWGTMLATAKSYMFDHPSYTLVVGLVLSLTIIALNLFGDAVREVIDPLVGRR